MRVLHLTPELPCWPGGTGGATRQFHLLRRLVELGHEVTVVAPIAAGEELRRDELERVGIRLRAAERPSSRPLEAVRAIAREPRLAARAATLPAVLTLQNVGRHYYESRARAAHGPRAAWFGFEARRFARHARRWLPRYRALVAVSDRDAADLRGGSLGGAVVEVVPNGVASDELEPLPPSDEPATLLFTGTLSHPPNAEGIRWFADRAWPDVRAARPDARLLVVGRDAPRAVLELAGRPGIEVVGAVPAMSPFFARATAVVVPLLSGGGTRLKILEAFACARSVVSTTTGCEGLAVEDGRELLVADGAEAFAAATLDLLNDADRRQLLAAAGRELAQRRYDWRALGDELAASLAEIAA